LNNIAVADRLYLAIDQGGHASRALIFDAHGNLLQSAYQEIETFTADGEIVEHDPEALISSIRSACDDVFAMLSQDQRQRVVAAGLATQRSSLIAWSRGQVLTPVISWQDRRASGEMDWLLGRSAVVREKTGLWVNPHYGASKIHWLLQHNPQVKQAADAGILQIAPVASFILHRILVEQPFKADPSNASRTLLMNVHQQAWDAELMSWTGVSVSMLPELCTTRHAWGALKIADCHIPLTVCTGDQAAAMFAQGQPEPDTCYINLGTGGFILQLADAKDVPSGLLHSVVASDETKCLQVVEGTVNGAARALDWLAQQYDIENWPEKLASAMTEAVDPPVFINAVSGLGSPWWRSSVQSRFVSEPENEIQAIASVGQSILFLLHNNLQSIKGLPRSRIVASGGLAANDGFVQCLADLTATRVERPQMHEATGRGLAFQMLPAGQDWRVQGEVFLPDSSKANEWRQRFSVWLEAMQAVVSSD